MKNQTALARAGSSILIALGFGILAIGFFSTEIWSALPDDRAIDILRISFYTAVLAWIVRLLQPMHYANSLLLVWLALHVLLVGVGPSTAATVTGLTAVGLGSLALPERIPGRLPLAAIAGLAILAGTLGWLLPFPIHYRAVYLLSAVTILWWRRRRIWKLLLEQIAGWKSRVTVSPRLSATAVMVLGLASTSTWLPTVQFDDLVYHLSLPTELSAHSYYRMDAASQVWALAPWAGDVVQAIAHVIAREDARSSVDLLWLAIVVLLILELNRRLGGTPQTGWLAVGSVGSLPLVVMLLGGMQAELPSLAVAAATALIVATAGRKPDPRRLLFLAICIAMGFALKITNILLMVPLGLWLLARWRLKMVWRETLPAAALGLVIAGSSYTYATLLTGNPVLPLFNGFFRSEYTAPQNFSDGRWLAPLRPDLLWRLTFATDEYCECWPGAAGFHWLALAGALPVALACRRTRGVTLCALAGAGMVFSEVRYLRYILPMLVLLVLAFTASLRTMVSVRVLALIFILLTVINVLYATNSSWILRGGVVKSVVYPSEGQERILRTIVPERLVADQLEASRRKDVRVLLADPARPFIAPFGGIAFTTTWYDPEVNTALFASGPDPEAHTWLEIFDRLGVSHVLATDVSQSANLTQALDAAGAEAEPQPGGGVTLYRLEHGFLPATVDSGLKASTATWTTDRNRKGATIVDARVRIRCITAEGGVFLTVHAYDDAGKVLAREEASSGCPKRGEIPLVLSLFSEVAPSRLEFNAHIGDVQNPAARMISPEVRLRKDAMKARDLSARIRQWIPFSIGDD